MLMELAMLFRTRTETACHPSTATKKLAVEIRCRTRELCVSGMRAFASKKGTWFARGVFVLCPLEGLFGEVG